MGKKLSAFILAAVMICSLTACGAVSSVQKQISAIGEVTDNSGDVIEQAWTSYNELSDEDKEKVENYSELVEAQDKYNAIEYAKEVNDLLAELGDDVAITDLYRVQAMRETYDALPDAVKDYVTDYDNLTAAEDALLEIYISDYDRLGELLETAAEATDIEVMDGVTGRRAIEEAVVLMEELQCFDYGFDDIDVDGYENLDEMHDELEEMETNFLDEICYPGTGIIKLDYIVGMDLSTLSDDAGTRYTNSDQYYYSINPDCPYGDEWRDEYIEYLDEHFTYVETFDDEIGYTIYSYEDDMGNNISLHFREVDISEWEVAFDTVAIYFDKAIVDQDLHGYNGTNPLADKPLEYAVTGDTVSFGSCEQDNNTDNGSEAIEWIVLDEDENGLMLMSKDVIVQHVFNEDREDTMWADSDCRDWLNGEFISEAFSDSEQEQIRTTQVTAEDNPEFGTDAGEDTEDKVFLLNVQQVMDYFPEPEDRICEASLSMLDQGMDPDENGHVAWATRSPGQNKTSVAICARNNGYILGIGDEEISLSSGSGGAYVNASGMGLRPVIWIDVDRYTGVPEADLAEIQDSDEETAESDESEITADESELEPEEDAEAEIQDDGTTVIEYDEDIVLLDNEYVTITAESKYQDGNKVGFHVLMVNNSDQYIMVVPVNFSVDGFMTDLQDGPFLANDTIAPGKKSATTLYFRLDRLTGVQIESIEDLIDTEGSWQVYTSETGESFGGGDIFESENNLP